MGEDGFGTSIPVKGLAQIDYRILPTADIFNLKICTFKTSHFFLLSFFLLRMNYLYKRGRTRIPRWGVNIE